MHAAFLELGFTHELIFNLFQSVAGILQAGNIEFIPNSEDLSNNDTCVISPASYEWFERVAHSWGVETSLLEKSLLFRIVQTGTHSPTHLLTHSTTHSLTKLLTHSLTHSGGGTNRRGSINYKPFDVISAKENVDAVAKALYNRCFDYIVSHINLLTNNKSNNEQVRSGLLTHWLTHWLTHSLTGLLIHSLAYSLTRWLTPSLHAPPCPVCRVAYDRYPST